MDVSWRDDVSNANRSMLLPQTLCYRLYHGPLLDKIWNDSPDHNRPCDCRELVSMRLILVAAVVVVVVRVVDEGILQHPAPRICSRRRAWESIPLHELANTEVAVVVGATRIVPDRRDRQMSIWILPIAFHLPHEIIRC